jgi:hypothetical protein
MQTPLDQVSSMIKGVRRTSGMSARFDAKPILPLLLKMLRQDRRKRHSSFRRLFAASPHQ